MIVYLTLLMEWILLAALRMAQVEISDAGATVLILAFSVAFLMQVQQYCDKRFCMKNG